MFKWLFILIIAFFISWIFFKNDFPDFVQNSGVADIMNTISYPAEELIDSQFPEVLTLSKKPEVYKLLPEQLSDFKRASETKDRQVIYYFYNPEGMSSKLILNSLNRLVKQYPYTNYNIDYLFIAITDDKEALSLYLKQFSKINFVPYFVSKSDYNSVLMLYQRNNLYPHTDLPRAIFKKNTQNEYMEVQSGFFTKGRLEVLIGQKI